MSQSLFCFLLILFNKTIIKFMFWIKLPNIKMQITWLADHFYYMARELCVYLLLTNEFKLHYLLNITKYKSTHTTVYLGQFHKNFRYVFCDLTLTQNNNNNNNFRNFFEQKICWRELKNEKVIAFALPIQYLYSICTV